MKKIIFSISIIILILMVPNYSRAFSMSSIFTKGKTFLEEGEKDTKVDPDDLSKTIVPIAQTLVAVGSLVVAVATGIMAIKYLMGSPEKRGELKGQLVGLVIATVVIFGGQIIWATLYNMLKDL